MVLDRRADSVSNCDLGCKLLFVGAPITATAAPGIDSLLTEQYEDTIQVDFWREKYYSPMVFTVETEPQRTGGSAGREGSIP